MRPQGLVLWISLAAGLAAQMAPSPLPDGLPWQGGESSDPGIPPALEDKAISLDIRFRVISARDPEKVWESREERATLPGRTIQLRMVSPSLVILVQLSPRPLGDGAYALRAGGQVWLSDGSGSLQYHASVTSLDVKKGDTVIFYPLGENPSESDLVEVLISLKPYRAESR